jgi:uncharacterized protein (TIGR00661 family)
MTPFRIVYGVQATGGGHIARAREVTRALKARGHDVRVVFSGRDPSGQPDLDVFRPFTVLRGLTFVTEGGRVRYRRTALQTNFFQFRHDIRHFDASGVELIVTDYEPVTSRVAKRHGIPCVGIGHQYAFAHPIPLAPGNVIGRLVLNRFAPARTPVGLHWHHFGHPILPPIVPPGLRPSPTTVEDKILVYLAFEAEAEVRAALEGIRTHDFFVYGVRKEVRDEGRLHFRPPSRDGFLEDLRDCNGVVCGAGFELPSEALHLGKRVLVKPLAGQVEQESNALALEQLGLGRVMRELDAGAIASWLDSPPIAPQDYPDVAGALADWIGTGRWDDPSDLAREMWGRCGGGAGPGMPSP